MNKKAYILLMLLWLMLRATASAWYDPTSKTFLSRDPIREAGGINLYAYCNNDPVGNHDPIGLQMPNAYNPFPGFPVTAADANRAVAIDATMRNLHASYDQATAMNNRSMELEQMDRDALKVYVGMELTSVGVMTGGSGAGALGLGADALMAADLAMFQQMAFNGIDARPLDEGVLQAGAGGALFGGGGSLVSRAASGAFASRILLRLPRFFRTSQSPAGFSEMPLGYQGGPGAMWIGETLGDASQNVSRHLAWVNDLSSINLSVERLGQRALQQSGGDWRTSEHLFENYLQSVQNRFVRLNSPFSLEIQPAAIPGVGRVPAFREINGRIFPTRFSRRLDAGIADRDGNLVSGFDITLDPRKPDIVLYYQEAFGDIPIFDIRLP